MVEGIVLAFPKKLRQISGWKTIIRAETPIKGQVALVSGGGSGHEPAHAGYVGKGMLTAACAGETFTSPSALQVFEAIRAVNGDAGVCLIIKNFSGDVMNFKTAAEMANAEGIEVKWVIVNDDVALDNPANRRGIAGTVFVHKCAGAKAEEGGSLKEVKRIAEKAVSNVRSMSCALTSCTVPMAGKPTFTLGEDEMELGIGIHGERGVKKMKLMKADDIAQTLANACVKDLKLKSGDEVAVLTQGNGGTPYMEKFILYRGLHRYLTRLGLQIFSSWVGEFMTSLEMAGASLSIMKLDEELKRLLEAPCDTMTIKY